MANSDVWWHGTASGDLRGGDYGLHVGTHQAATEALTARIGHPVHGEWDGTRRYGDTLLQGQATIRARGGYPTGHNCGVPEHDHYPDPAGHFPHASHVTPDSTPNVFPLRIHGPMGNHPDEPARDDEANEEMHYQRGDERGIGLYYRNVGEHPGSVSAVVPHQNHIEPIPRGQHGVDYHGADRHTRELTDADYGHNDDLDFDDDWHHHGAYDESGPAGPDPDGDPEPPPCAYCGAENFSAPEDTGRAQRITCGTCNATMVAPYGASSSQYAPDLIGSPHNHPSMVPDGRSGGVGGVANDGVVNTMTMRSTDHTASAPTVPATDPRHEELAQHFEGLGHHLSPVKHVGFAGYVEPHEGFDDEMREMGEEDPGPGHGDIDEKLWSKARPEPRSDQERHFNEHGEYPDSHHEEHYDNYDRLLGEHQDKYEQDRRPVGHHRELGNFLGEKALDHDFWNSKAETTEVHPHKQPIYAMQPFVVNHHVARYLRKPDDKVAYTKAHEEHPQHGSEEMLAEHEKYAGAHMPMMIKHEGNLFTIEGHHRTSRALLTGNPVHVSMWDADKHGLPGEDGTPSWGHDHDSDEPFSGFQRHGMLIGVPSCAYGHLTGRAAWAHALYNHDDGICCATEARGHTASRTAARQDPELRFHMTATWADVRDKAARISREGGVHIAVASDDGIGGTVRGDHDLYETMLGYVPGSRKVGYWTCGCKWASYAWGRSPAYQRFEGRMCSHALALQFEALKQHAFNRKQVEEHDFRPAWMRDKEVVVHHQRVTDRAPAVDFRRPASLRVEAVTDHELQEGIEALDLGRPPLYAFLATGAAAGVDPGALTVLARRQGFDQTSAITLVREAVAETLVARIRHVADNPLDEFRRDILMLDPAEHYHGNGGGSEHQPGHAEQKDEDDEKPDTPDKNNNPLAPHHQTEDSRAHAPEPGVGVPGGDTHEPVVSCTQCQDQGCGHCGGAGQVDLDDRTTIPDQNTDAGPYSRGQGIGGGGIPTFSSWMRQGEYSSYDWQGDPVVRTPNKHVDSPNPVSTGWATGPDPADWSGITPGDKNYDSVRSLGSLPSEVGGPTHAGVCLKALDTGRVLMLQRSHADETDPARGKWEFPGGGIEEGDATPLHGAVREHEEETGMPFPGGEHMHDWTAHDANGTPRYRGYVIGIPSEAHYPLGRERTVENPDDDNEQVAWWHPDDARGNKALREEVKASPWQKIKNVGQPPVEKVSIMHAYPEPALPSTEADEDSTENMGATPGERQRAQMSGEIGSDQTSSTPNSATYASLMPEDEGVAAIVAQFQATAGARALDAPTPAQRQRQESGEPGGGDIAAAAREHLSKEAMASFSPGEQRELIEEGRDGPRARNFGDLQIEGTHYADVPEEELMFG